MAGYSGTPLIKKLGIKPGMRAVALGAPENFGHLLGPLPSGLQLGTRLSKELDYIHLFAKKQAQIEAKKPSLLKSLSSTGMLWVSWPKKASKVPTDITEDVLRTLLLPTGLVDVKVCAVDEVWSGLKFMWRKENRK